jgi:putative peptidoglycan lipid II flippase
MGPALLGVSTSQLNLLLNTLMASFLGAGAISWLYYAERLMEFPLGILAVALSTVLLPQLSRQRQAGEQDEQHAILDWGLRWAVMLGLPAAVGLALLAQPIMATLFLSADFSAQDVLHSARALAAYALAIPALVLVKLLSAACYARHDVRNPLRQGLWSMALNLLFSLLLVGPLGHAGLALATSLAAWFNAAMLYRVIRREGSYRPLPGWRGRWWRLGVALSLMAVLLRWGALLPGNWVDMERVARLESLLMLMVGAGGGYFGLLALLGVGRREWWPSGQDRRIQRW